MHFTTLLTATVGLLAASAAAVPTRMSFTGLPFSITNLLLTRVETANATLNFTIHDPDPLTNATSLCGGTWKYNSGGWPVGAYQPCGSTTFAWRMESFESWTNFTLGVEHSFTDPSIGEPPYDRVSTFGEGTFSSTFVFCSAMGGREVCTQPAGTEVQAPITRTSAKKRRALF